LIDLLPFSDAGVTVIQATSYTGETEKEEGLSLLIVGLSVLKSPLVDEKWVVGTTSTQSSRQKQTNEQTKNRESIDWS
jgi:hypothetical protein